MYYIPLYSLQIHIILMYVWKTRKNRRFNNIYKRINSETARNLNGDRVAVGPLASNLLNRTATVGHARSVQRTVCGRNYYDRYCLSAVAFLSTAFGFRSSRATNTVGIVIPSYTAAGTYYSIPIISIASKCPRLEKKSVRKIVHPTFEQHIIIYYR